MRTSWLALVVMVVIAGAGGEARAQADVDAKASFSRFVDGVAGGAPLPAGLELFVVPPGGEVPLPTDELEDVRKQIPETKAIKFLSTVISPGGRSAWIAAEIAPAGPSARAKKPPATIRASAVLSLEGTDWKVRMAHWSIGKPNRKPEMCGALDYEWILDPAVPPALAPAVAVVMQALDSGKPAQFLALLSDDKRAQVFGSAPKESFAGGAKIKGIFKKWKVELTYWDKDDPKLPARAGATPDGELMWVALGVAYYSLCTSYRTTFVMAKEKGAWKIVHHHYSEPVYPD